MVGAGHLEQSVRDEPDVQELLAVVDAELAHVFAFILRRCGDRALAEDLTADVVLRAVRETKRTGTVVTPAWLTTVARNRLVDHWRSAAREERRLRLAWSGRDDDRWVDDEGSSDPGKVCDVLARLRPDHQAVLCLRYLDDLTVPQVAAALGRSVHATESLLVRARRAFRSDYTEQTDG